MVAEALVNPKGIIKYLKRLYLVRKTVFLFISLTNIYKVINVIKIKASEIFLLWRFSIKSR